MNQEISKICINAKYASKELRRLNTVQKNKILEKVSKNLIKNKDLILERNSIDLKNSKEANLSKSLIDRLLLDEQRIKKLAESVEQIITLPDPIGIVTDGKILNNGIELITKRVPLGVIMIIYESRPNVTIDVGSLSFKSGNACILRGGKESIHTNKILASLFQTSLKEENINPDSIQLIENLDRTFMIPFFKATKFIDLIVPRGGEQLIQFVSENSIIPVIKHDKGVCNLYIDESANFEKAKEITINSKVQRPGVCNAIENLIIHKNFPKIKELLEELKDQKVDLFLEQPYHDKFKIGLLVTEEMYGEEFLDLRLSVKIVNSIEDSIKFIETYSSGHTEAIVSENISSIQKFKDSLDSAGIYINCSTRFHDGGEYGLGAEIGISTGKLHVRGPMGLIHLTTTTTYLSGTGQIRN